MRGGRLSLATMGACFSCTKVMPIRSSAVVDMLSSHDAGKFEVHYIDTDQHGRAVQA